MSAIAERLFGQFEYRDEDDVEDDAQRQAQATEYEIRGDVGYVAYHFIDGSMLVLGSNGYIGCETS
jgi:hypothetical protein